MKKVITLCFFVFAMVFSTASLSAQNKIEINAEASEQMEVLRQRIKFNDEQKEDVYQAYKEFGTAKAKLNKSATQKVSDVENIKKQLQIKMKNILTEEQFEIYKGLTLTH
ncbi:MAG: hypothetical protein ACPGUH_05025 [Winogradskyella sp.]